MQLWYMGFGGVTAEGAKYLHRLMGAKEFEIKSFLKPNIYNYYVG